MIYFVTQTGTPWEKKGELRTETAIGKNIHLIKSYYVYFVALISCESTSISWIQISGFVPDTVLCTEHCVCVCKLLFQLCLTLWPFSCVWLCDPMDCTCQAPMSMRFSRQEYWSVLPWHPSRDLSDRGIEPVPLTYPTLAGGFFTTRATWEALAHDTISLQNTETLPLSQAGERFQWLFKLFTYNCSTFMKK